MKKIMYFFILLLAVGPVYSQQQIARDGMIAYNKSDKSAAVIDLPYPPDVVEQSFKDYFSAKGAKSDKNRGFLLFRGVSLGDAVSGMADLYIKVERKSRQEKNSSMVYLIPARPGEDISTRSSVDREKVEDGKLFLDNMAPFFLAKNTESEINDQSAKLLSAEKKLANLLDQHMDLEKKIRSLQQKLEENKQEQLKQQENVNKEKEILEVLKAKRQE